MMTVKTLPSTFVKTFVYDYAEEIDDKVNAYAEKHRLEIKSITVGYLTVNDFFYATVLFERGVVDYAK
jgi:hypothetical protein